MRVMTREFGRGLAASVMIFVSSRNLTEDLPNEGSGARQEHGRVVARLGLNPWLEPGRASPPVWSLLRLANQGSFLALRRIARAVSSEQQSDLCL
jgi:hypothetical protein